jgi:hypothetical protein
MTFLPDAGNAMVEESKVVGYLLNAGHPKNGGKSVFFAAFGFAIDQWDLLRDALRRHPVANRVADTQQSPHGVKYAVRCFIETPDGRDPCITSIWITDGVGPPRLVTAYP